MAHTQEEIRAQLLINIEDGIVEYDLMQELMQESETEVFDVFVRLAYHFSEMALSVDQMKTASKMMANLAVSTLAFNVEQADASEELCEAAFEALK